MLTLRTRCGDIIVMAARIVHRPVPLVGSCFQDQCADEAHRWDAPTGTLLWSYQGSPAYLRDAILTAEGMVIGGDSDGVLLF